MKWNRWTMFALFVVMFLPVGAACQDDVDPLQDWFGAFRTVDGGVLTLLKLGRGHDAGILFTDFARGYRGIVDRSGDRRLTLRLESPSPFEKEVVLSLRLDGSDPTLDLSVDGEPRSSARKVPLDVTDVRFEQADHELAGTVVSPTGGSGRPGVVFIHGSGPATRHDYYEWSYFFAAHGIASLMYDKQGAGESTGDWENALFAELAADAAAAVRFLRTFPGVDPGKVGLSGGSQGGWVAPMAARVPEEPIAFLEVTGGGPVTPREQERFRRLALVRARDLPATTLETAGTVLDCYLDFVGSLGVECAGDLRRYVLEYGEEDWYLEDVGGPRRDPLAYPWPTGRKRFARELDFDPRPLYESLAIPVLVVLGRAEQTFPIDLTLERVQRLVPGELLSVELIDDADHGLFVDASSASPRHQSAVAMSRLADWILTVTGSR